jgi:hypothetical protein
VFVPVLLLPPDPPLPVEVLDSEVLAPSPAPPPSAGVSLLLPQAALARSSQQPSQVAECFFIDFGPV